MSTNAITVKRPLKPKITEGKPGLIVKVEELNTIATEQLTVKEPKAETVFIAKPAVFQNPVIEKKPEVSIKKETISEPEYTSKSEVIPDTETIDNEKMGWKPKTIVGKILKGAVIAGGTALAVGSGVGAIAGVVGGSGLLAGAAGGAGVAVKTLSALGQGAGKLVSGVAKGTVNTLSKVGTAAVNLVTGTTKVERQQVQEVKKEAKAAQDQLDQVQRLINAGATEADARRMAGLTADELPEVNGKVVPADNSKLIMYGAIGLAALFLLPKIMKR